MFAVPATPAEQNFLRDSLRSALRGQAGASHIAEAMPFSMGYRTHAALLADMRSKTPPDVLTINTRNFADRLSALSGAEGVGAEQRAGQTLFKYLEALSNPSARQSLRRITDRAQPTSGYGLNRRRVIWAVVLVAATTHAFHGRHMERLSSDTRSIGFDFYIGDIPGHARLELLSSQEVEVSGALWPSFAFRTATRPSIRLSRDGAIYAQGRIERRAGLWIQYDGQCPVSYTRSNERRVPDLTPLAEGVAFGPRVY